MKSRRSTLIKAMVFFCLSSILTLHGFAQGTAFTYQGRLNDGTNLASGTYDLRFTVLDSNAGGEIFGGPVTNLINVPNNGIFTVTLDFGAGVFTGGDRWLEIGVRTNGGGAFDTLLNRQPITPTPYAVQATIAGNLTGVVVASGAGFTNLTGANVIGAVSDALHASFATNAPDGKPLVSNAGVTNIVTLINSNNMLNVLDFGAIGDNSKDNTTNIQNAIDSHTDGRFIYFPPGKYIISGTLYLTNQGVSFFGAGAMPTDWGGGASTLIFTGTSHGFYFATIDMHNTTFRDLSIRGPGTDISTGAAFNCTNGMASLNINNVYVENWNTAFLLNRIAISQWNNVNIGRCTWGIDHRDVFTPFSLTFNGGAIVDCKNVISKAIWTFISTDMGNQPTGHLFEISGGAHVTLIGCNVEQNVATNSAGMILINNAAVNIISGRVGGSTGPAVVVTNGGALVLSQNASLASSTPAPIWSYNADDTITSDGTFRILITNIPYASTYGTGQPGIGHAYSSTLRVQSLGNPALRFAMFIDEFADFRGSTLSFVGKMFGSWQPMDLLEYYKDKRLGVIPLLNTPNTGNLTTSGVITGGNFSGNGGGLTNLIATNLAGSIAEAQLSTNIPRLNASQTFTGTNIFNSRIGIKTNNPGATLDVNGSMRVGHGTTIFSNLQAGLAQMTNGATTTRTNFTFTFPKAFVSSPNVLVSARSETNVEDTFAVTVRLATTTNCTVNVARVGTTGGWTQHVKVTWMAWE